MEPYLELKGRFGGTMKLRIWEKRSITFLILKIPEESEILPTFESKLSLSRDEVKELVEFLQQFLEQ